MAVPEREVPVCTVFLSVGALVAHVLVLVGNLHTAGLVHNLGASTAGWSGVGLDIATAMQYQLAPAMSNMSYYLTQTIEAVSDLQETTDMVLSVTGSATDAALTQYNGTQGNRQQVKDEIMGELRNVTGELFRLAQPQVDELLYLMKPITSQLQEWLESFGSKVQPTIQEFTGTLDKAQKIFDEIMSQLGAGVGGNEEAMVYNTYTLFDTDNSGTVNLDDLQTASSLFGISALAGAKAQELFTKYDANGKGGLDVAEFTLFVNDPSLPGIMSVVLRKYSQALSAVGGQLAGARQRDEVAQAVTKYVQIISSKNLTRLSWVSQALTNGSVPIQFTADVLREFAAAVDDPAVLTVVDVGATALGEMVRLNAAHVVKALTLLSEPGFWAAEGFPGEEQPAAVARVVNWTAAAPGGAAALKQGGLDFRTGDESFGDAAFNKVQERQSRYAASHLRGKSSSQAAVYSASASRHLRDQLLGGNGAAAASENPEADYATKVGIPAMPQTLQFAGWLANNATSVAQAHLEECFAYAGKSSGALDSSAKEVSGLFAKVQSFLNTMTMYSTPEGSVRLVNQSLEFVRYAADDVLMVCEEYVDAQLAEIDCQLGGGLDCNMTQQQRDMSLDLSGAFNFVTGTLGDLKSSLPSVVKDLKFAKTGVTNVANTMNTVMTVMGMKAPPLMYQIAELLKVLWVVYFVFFSLVSTGVLFYGFWASGWFGGPRPASEEDRLPQPSAGERLRTCWASCTACCRGCHDSALCFWSSMLLAEVLVLVLYLVCVAICILGGLQAVMSNGCLQVYILGDNSVCSSAMNVVNVFLKGFWQKPYPISEACESETLLTCQVLRGQVTTSVLIAVIGGVLAATLSFWMVIESAVMHERARVRRLLDGEAKRK